MKRYVKAVMMVIIMVAAPGSIVFSQHGGGLYPFGRGFYPEFSYSYNYRMLDLSDDQLEQMREIRLELIEILEPLQSELQDIRAEYRKLLQDEADNLEAINENIDKQTAVQNKIMKANAQFRNKFRDVLTEDQKKLAESGMYRRRGFYGKRNPPGHRYYGRGMGRGFGRGYGRRGIW